MIQIEAKFSTKIDQSSDNTMVEVDNEWSEELDEIPLKQRWKMLLAAKNRSNLGVNKTQSQSIASADIIVKKEAEDCVSQDLHSGYFLGEGRVESSSLEEWHSNQVLEGGGPRECHIQNIEPKTCKSSNKVIVSELNHSDVTVKNLVSLRGNCLPGSSSAEAQPINVKTELSDDFLDDLDHIVLAERRRMLLARKSLEMTKPVGEENIADSSSIGPHCPASVCPSQVTESTISRKRIWSSKLAFVNVKAEPLDNKFAKNALDNSFLANLVPVKSEPGIADASFGDNIIDHMVLRERMKLLASEASRKIIPSTVDCRPISSEPARPLTVKLSRKRKKTATNLVETALEEDAPGLLQVLVDKGVLVDEIKLYGQTEINEALDESLNEDSFSELEDVMSKLFCLRHSLLKLPPRRCSKGEKISYCLSCLISLVEQARYLQFRKWPVEWGWCRDLQSFIFVFERHKRVVLERPEYGYATYFFELLDSLPIDWQIKRLVTTMKLASCSRATLIENKPLMIGEDLSQGEARVLEEYGWIPNTGLATMLNYCDRIYHDRKKEKDTSEWRSKIGNLLMEGYSGGTIITDIPKKVVEYGLTQSPQIKLEP